MPKKTVTVAARIPSELRVDLMKICDDLEVTTSEFLNWALEQAISNQLTGDEIEPGFLPLDPVIEYLSFRTIAIAALKRMPEMSGRDLLLFVEEILNGKPLTKPSDLKAA